MAERVTKTVGLEGEIVNNQVVLKLPVDTETAVQVKDNKILVGDRPIVIELGDDIVYPTIH